MGSTSPSVEIYTTAGVSGIDATNFADANTLVESLVYEDVDTVEEIQALVDGLNANTAPVATAQSITLDEDTSKAITFTGTDADGDTLSYTVTTQPSHGTIVNNTYTPNANYFGNDSFGFMANDGTVDSVEATVSITVIAVNDAPTLSALADVTKEEDSAPFDVTLSAVDVDSGDTITYSASATDASKVAVSVSGSTLTITATDNAGATDTQTFTVTLTAVNDAPVATAQTLTTAEDTAKAFTLSATDVEGDALTYTITTQPTHGTITGNTYTPNANYFGSDSFGFVANDGTVDSAEATVSITVTALNDAPVATAQTLTTAEDTAKAFTLSATDVDGDALTYTITSQPTHGIIVNNTYTPNANYFGNDSFTFVANDGTVDSAEATVSITVTAVNDAPVATAQSITLDEDTTSKVTLSGTDPDNDSIVKYTITTFPQHGYLTEYSNNWTYYPNQNYHGTDSFSFTVNDGKADSLPATVDLTVTPVNDAPFAYNSNYKIAVNSSVTIELNATDVDNTPDKITYKVTSQPTNGSYDATTKTYTPATDFTGVDSFTYTATDPDGLNSTATVYVNVGIPAPYITTWKTDNEGNTTDTQIKIGTYSDSTYNFTVEWGVPASF